MVTIVLFYVGKGLFFIETVEETTFLQELGIFKIQGGYTVKLRRWSPREKTEVLGKFKIG